MSLGINDEGTLRRATGWGSVVALVAIIGTSCVSIPKPHPRSGPAETSEVNNFASELETLAEDQFPNTFAGSVRSSEGVVTVYAKSHDHALVAATANINPNGDRVKFVISRFSFNELNRLADDLGNHADQLRRDGVNLTERGPEPPFDAVYVTVLRPTRFDIRRLSGSGLVPRGMLPVSRNDYIDAANAVISTVARPNYRVRHTFGDRVHAV